MRVLSRAGDSLIWGLVLVSILICACGIVLTEIVQGLIEDEAMSLETRRWAYTHFGTTSHACWTLFESTLTGSWVRFSRRTIDELSVLFAIFWVLYIIFVNFAVIRIISAMFLKQTMAVANADAESLAIAANKRMNQYCEELLAIFRIADADGTGTISKEEFTVMMLDDEVLNRFERLDLKPNEVEMLFTVLSHGSGEADYEEFVHGAMKMKASARAIDTVVLQTNQKKMMEAIKQI